MFRNMLAIILTVTMILSVTGNVFAADAKKPAAPAAPQGPRPMPPKPAFSMIAGTISKIDTTDPANVKIELQNEADKTTRVISVTPMTNITKITDVSELKAGDAVRVMSKKSDTGEVAMGIMFGKLAARPMPRPAAANPHAPQAPAKQ